MIFKKIKREITENGNFLFKNKLQQVFKMFNGIMDTINNIREERARNSLPPSIREKYSRLVHTFGFESVNNRYASCSGDWPGPYFIAWYDNDLHEKPRLIYTFSYVKNILKSKKQALAKRQIIAYIGEILKKPFWEWDNEI